LRKKQNAADGKLATKPQHVNALRSRAPFGVAQVRLAKQPAMQQLRAVRVVLLQVSRAEVGIGERWPGASRGYLLLVSFRKDDDWARTRMEISISAILSRLPCLGVQWNSSLRKIRRVWSGSSVSC
jgi:hypothetical protein